MSNKKKPSSEKNIEKLNSIPIEKTLCIICKNEIPKSALECTSCGNSQKRWWHWLKSFGLIAGFLTAIVTAIIHSLSLVPVIIKWIHPRVDVQIVEVKSNQRVVIINKGDHEVYITHLVLEHAKGSSYVETIRNWQASVQGIPANQIKINQKVERVPFLHRSINIGRIIMPNEVLHHQVEDEYSETQNPSTVHHWPTLEWERLLVLTAASGNSNCLKVVYFSTSDHRYKSLKSTLGSELNEFPAVGRLGIYSPDLNKFREVIIDLVGLIVLNEGDECCKKLHYILHEQKGKFITSLDDVPEEWMKLPCKNP